MSQGHCDHLSSKGKEPAKQSGYLKGGAEVSVPECGTAAGPKGLRKEPVAEGHPACYS